MKGVMEELMFWAEIIALCAGIGIICGPTVGLSVEHKFVSKLSKVKKDVKIEHKFSKCNKAKSNAYSYNEWYGMTEYLRKIKTLEQEGKVFEEKEIDCLNGVCGV